MKLYEWTALSPHLRASMEAQGDMVDGAYNGKTCGCSTDLGGRWRLCQYHDGFQDAEAIVAGEPSDAVTKLSEFIMDEIFGEPSRSEGAIDTAIRVMREQIAFLAAGLVTAEEFAPEAMASWIVRVRNFLGPVVPAEPVAEPEPEPAPFTSPIAGITDEDVDEFLEALVGDLTFRFFGAQNLARALKWHDGVFYPEDGRPGEGWTGADWSNAMMGEAGEAANVVKKLRRIETEIVGVDVSDEAREDLVNQLGWELADTIAYVDLLAAYYRIDLARAVRTKFNFVSEREGFEERL